MLTKLRTHAIATVAVTLAALSGAPAIADATLAGASQVAAGESAHFQARGLGANSAVTIIITTPDGVETADNAMTDSDGNLDYSLTPTAAGEHIISIMTSDGQVVARATLIAR